MYWRSERYLRDSKTKEWLTPRGAFSPEKTKAVVVPNISDAIKLSERHPDRHLEMVLKFPIAKDEMVFVLT